MASMGGTSMERNYVMYEYKAFLFVGSENRLTAELNEYAEQGWRLANITAEHLASSHIRRAKFSVVMEREKRNDPDMTVRISGRGKW
jgi:hypothetical protein